MDSHLRHVQQDQQLNYRRDGFSRTKVKQPQETEEEERCARWQTVPVPERFVDIQEMAMVIREMNSSNGKKKDGH